MKIVTYSAPVLFKKPTPSQINLIKNANNNILLLNKFKNTESAQPWSKSTSCFVKSIKKLSHLLDQHPLGQYISF